MTIASELIGVVTSSSRVCFSRSRLIAPAVDDGARNTTCRVISISSAAKMPWPMAALAKADVPPNPVVKLRLDDRSTMSAKPPSSSR